MLIRKRFEIIYDQPEEEKKRFNDQFMLEEVVESKDDFKIVEAQSNECGTTVQIWLHKNITK